MSDLEYAGVDLTGIESAFQRRMVEQDLGKSLASHLAQDTSDLVVYDPIDERFDLAVHPVSGAVCTLSAELSRAAHVPVSRTILSGSEEFYVLWERGWVRLLAALDAREGARTCVSTPRSGPRRSTTDQSSRPCTHPTASGGPTSSWTASTAG